MKPIVRVTLVLLAFAYTLTTHAQTPSNATGWTQITQFGCHAVNDICFLRVEAAVTNPEVTSCPNPGQIRWRLSDPGGEAIFSLVSTATATGKEIAIYLNSSCLGNYPRVNYVWIR